MINPQWLELPMSRTIFYGPRDVRAIEFRLYLRLRLFIIINIFNCGAFERLRLRKAVTVVSVETTRRYIKGIFK